MALKRFLAAALLAAFAIALWPAPAQAQRRAVGRPGPAPRAVIVSAYPPFYYDPWWPYRHDWYGPYPYGPWFYNDAASLRLQVTPRSAEVYVDGYYAGIVDQFDGTFQRLRVEPGAHEIVVYAEGFRTFRQRLYFQPLTTVTVKEALERLPEGEAQDAKPSPAPIRAPRRARPAAPAPVPAQPGDSREPQAAPPPIRNDTSSGVLSLRVQPGGADVVIDGERWEGPESSERLLVQLSPGPHRIEVSRSGYETFSLTIEVRGGETETLNVSLSRQ